MTIMSSILRKSGFGALAGAAVLAGTVTASAATMFAGDFTVQAVNVTNVDSSQSAATVANFNAALGLAGATTDTFTYNGALNFETTDGSDSTTIKQWLDTGSGALSGLDATFGGTQLSAPDINNGSATTTFFSFVVNRPNAIADFFVRHDDGINIYDDGSVLAGGSPNPTSVRNSTVSGFDGGEFRLIYVATNGDPSILEVSAVPLPAGGLLLLTALGGVAALRRKRKEA